ncbi:MAG TPA: RluA family pseudouridine synthase, partial [Verrucomicrobiae bacterium]|nr:RluA family pseudouridine synthase [Verrucomicrobiae bacterium]
MPPCIIFEDEHLLVVNKPAGMNTHAPSPYAGEGIYEWLRHREPRWAKLAIIHRLDKETSGVLAFGKTPAANRSLTEQFTRHTIRKQYQLITDRSVKPGNITVTSSLVRAGEKYMSRPLHAGGERAETRFRASGRVAGGTLVEAEPVTGRTHQIRAHAAAEGFPIMGDTLYGGTAGPRVYLHAGGLTLKHPVTGEEMNFRAPADFEAEARLVLREALIEPQATNAYRLIHGAADGWPEWYVERLGEYMLSQAERPLTSAQ